VDRQGTRVSDIGHVIKHFQGIDELAPRVASPLELEAEQAAISPLEVGIRTPARLTRLHAGKNHVRDFGVLRKKALSFGLATEQLSFPITNLSGATKEWKALSPLYRKAPTLG